jgi:uncharacterized protein YpiB (UPF0302 family)
MFENEDLKILLKDEKIKQNEKYLIAMKLGFENRKEIYEIVAKKEYKIGHNSQVFAILSKKKLCIFKNKYIVTEKGDQYILDLLNKNDHFINKINNIQKEIDKQKSIYISKINSEENEISYNF